MPEITDQNIPNGSPLTVTVPTPFVPPQNPPGAGGMVPPSWVPPVIGLVVAIGSALLDVVGLGTPLSGVVIAKAVMAGFVAWFGGKSAGPRKPV